MKMKIPALLKVLLRRILGRVSRSRSESNKWIRRHAADINGRVLSLGTGDDSDGQGGSYRDFFYSCTEYVTSEIDDSFNCDLVLDVRSMPEVPTASFDCIFCSGVLEHVNDLPPALSEIARIVKPGGVLLLGLPFRQSLHLAPHDYWRFTEYGIRTLLARDFAILDLTPIDASVPDFPAAYWCKATRR